MPLFELSTKVFFITGGAQGFGKAYAKALLERGSKIFLSDVNEEIGAATVRQLARHYGADRVKFEPLDVTNRKQFQLIFDKAVGQFGQVDVMVNNAGIMDESKRRLMVDTNFNGTVAGTEIAYEHMRMDRGGKGGRIINTAPAAGLSNCYSVPVYCGLSHAIRAFTSSMSEQPNCADLGLEFGTICSNHAATEIVSSLTGDKVHFIWSMQAKLRQETLGIDKVVDAFLDLVSLEEMNGAALFVSRDQKVFVETQSFEIGKEYPPSTKERQTQ